MATSTRSNTETSKAKPNKSHGGGKPCGVYLGDSKKSGLLKVRVGGAPFLVEGAVFPIIGPGRTANAIRVAKVPEYASPGFRDDNPANARKTVTDKATGELVRVVGIFRPFEKARPATDKLDANASAIVTESQPVPPVVAAGDANLAPSIAKTARRRQVRDPMREMASQLEAIGAARQQGIDLDVGLDFVVAYLKTSRASIYRGMASGRFPPGFVRGGRRRWLFSEIEKFRLCVNAGVSVAQSERAIEAEGRHG